MSKKNVLIKLSWIILIIFSVFLYLWFYVVSSIEEIGRRKRELKDMNLKIENLKGIQAVFPFPDAKEKALLKNAHDALRKRIPVIRDNAGLNALLVKVTDYINKRARADGILHLRITNSANRVNLPKDGIILLNLGFSGSAKNVAAFINHLPWGDYYVIPGNITVMPAGKSLYYSVVLQVYTADEKGEIRGPSGQDMIIDLQSPLLLKRVYENPVEVYRRRELSPKYGGDIL